MRASKRWMVAAAAVALGASALVSTSASAGPGLDEPDADRLSGANRYATAAALNSDRDFGIDGTDIIIANGLNFPDGLTAAVFGLPILLVETDAIPADTLAELERIDGDDEDGITGITVVGGTAAVSGEVYEQLTDFADPSDIKRLRGSDRYGTALDVAEEFEDFNEGIDTVIIATGLNFPDALAAGPLAYLEEAPILLNDGPVLSAANTEFIEDSEVSTAYVVGGTAAVPEIVKLQLQGPLGLSTTRLSGSNRDATAVAIAEELYPDTGEEDGAPGVVVVNRLGFADALAGGPFASWYEYPILLVGNDSIPAETAAWHVENCASIGQIFAVGGTAVISNGVVSGAVDAATCAGPEITSATLVIDNLTAREVTVTETEGGDSGDTTLTAIGDALGSEGNSWTITFVDSAVASEQGADIGCDLDVLGDCTSATRTIEYTDDFDGLDEGDFEDNWNASDAGDLFDANGGAGEFTGAPDTIDSFDGELGTFDAEVVVTFSTDVEATGGGVPEVQIWSSSNEANGVVLLGFGLQAPSPLYPFGSTGVSDFDPDPFPAAGDDVVTYMWEDQIVPAPGALASSAIVFDGELQDADTGLTNDDLVLKTLTAG